MRYIILDTSSILFAVSNRKDIFEEVRYQLPDMQAMISTGILAELKGIARSGRSNAKFAATALHQIGLYGPAMEKGYGPVDQWIVKHALHGDHYVCTNDAKLKSLLIKAGIKSFSFSRSGRIR
jgi:rRNA-processing protein FCF1